MPFLYFHSAPWNSGHSTSTCGRLGPQRWGARFSNGTIVGFGALVLDGHGIVTLSGDCLTLDFFHVTEK